MNKQQTKGFVRELEALKDIPRLVEEVAKNRKEDIIALMKRQLWRGQASDGSQIKPPYKQSTIRYKGKKGAPTDRVTLEDTGAFYDSIEIIVKGPTIEFTARNWKYPLLKQRYEVEEGNPELLTLNEEHIDIMMQDLVGTELLKRINAIRVKYGQ